ncbi:multicopper oxidase family protein [Sulfitobacter mediterraneus]|nr:multicopper oxidase family protein [Sulfitobacter mediterraneus]MBM1312133.1 multicopper oxidase family protein [Sulfitobacter mediterraneus]MBM1316086.1 multicopper oxidase family protein [Sulfitobacter mediterraneus]MBM1324374.1 multicopper oxidase family protein [Sulfitobacter mediterraneus]MBM1328321.1 multicopper oxidase family protein [Sulfitobacter mediterraneus]MBM1399650.1 multicopper oxidase family protein [Sulfitobacter mediterraneus]
MPSVAAAQNYVLRPEPVMTSLGGVRQELLGFNGSWPGPELRARQGDDMRVRVENGLKDGVLVHWHGLRLPNRMDGVNVLTQDVIPPDVSNDYRFPVPDAGTFWYHSHYLSYDQVSRGLFGPLIIDEQQPPDVDHDITVQLFDMLTDDSGVYDEDTGAEQFTSAGRIGNVMTAIVSRETVQRGDRVRLRLINPSIDRVYSLRINGIEGMIVALDGMPLEQPRPFEDIILAPGQRCDVLGDVSDEITFADDDAGRTLGRIAVHRQRQRRTTAIPTLPPNPMPQPKGREVKARLVIQGGAGGGKHGGFGTWALNDVSGLPREPLLNGRRGTTARISLRNDTGYDHVMHLHGHHFWELSENGEPGDYRDGTLVRAGEGRDILCVLDNPGNWMFHCHMLSHQADGMATWLRVG